jgi:cytochrome c oxidase subunit 4
MEQTPTAEGHKHPNYGAIWCALAGLTMVELLVAQLPRWLPNVEGITRTMIILLVGLALAKALLVALFFMHLRFERKTFVIIVSAPVILAVVLILGLLPDVGFQGR